MSAIGIVMARDTAKLFVSNNVTYGAWWDFFTEGMNNRMGDNVIPDLAISLNLMGALVKMFELNFMEVTQLEEKSHIPTVSIFCITGYLGGLREEKIVKLSVWPQYLFCR